MIVVEPILGFIDCFYSMDEGCSRVTHSDWLMGHGDRGLGVGVNEAHRVTDTKAGPESRSGHNPVMT